MKMIKKLDIKLSEILEQDLIFIKFDLNKIEKFDQLLADAIISMWIKSRHFIEQDGFVRMQLLNFLVLKASSNFNPDIRAWSRKWIEHLSESVKILDHAKMRRALYIDIYEIFLEEPVYEEHLDFIKMIFHERGHEWLGDFMSAREKRLLSN